MATTTRKTVLASTPDAIILEAAYLPVLDERFAKLAKRAAKLGLDSPPSYREIERWTETRRVFTDTGRSYLRTFNYVAVVVEGTEVALDGWQFVAAIEHVSTKAGDCIVRTVPGTTAAAPSVAWADAARPTCDHCGTTRRRNDTYILDHVDGRRVQIGRTCLRDYLGHGTPENIARRVSWLANIVVGLRDEVEGCFAGRGEYLFEAVDFVAFVEAVVRCYGYTSKGKAYNEGGTPTASTAMQLLCSSKACSEAEKADNFKPPTQADYTFAAEAVEWSQTALVDTRNDYLRNLRVACGVAVNDKRSGFAASLAAAYRREQGKVAQRQADAERQAAQPASGYLGTKGERLTVEATVVFTKWIETFYGSSCLCKFETVDGNSLTWFASNPDEAVVKSGNRVTLTGTVKKHDDYKGRKGTVVTRCRVALR